MLNVDQAALVRAPRCVGFTPSHQRCCATLTPDFAALQQCFVFGIHWSHAGRMYYDELSANGKDEVEDYFNRHKRPGVTLVETELIGPQDMPVEQRLKHPARI